jgi:hypothetical protein
MPKILFLLVASLGMTLGHLSSAQTSELTDEVVTYAEQVGPVRAYLNSFGLGTSDLTATEVMNALNGYSDAQRSAVISAMTQVAARVKVSSPSAVALAQIRFLKPNGQPKTAEDFNVTTSALSIAAAASQRASELFICQLASGGSVTISSKAKLATLTFNDGTVYSNLLMQIERSTENKSRYLEIGGWVSETPAQACSLQIQFDPAQADLASLPAGANIILKDATSVLDCGASRNTLTSCQLGKGLKSLGELSRFAQPVLED